MESSDCMKRLDDINIDFDVGHMIDEQEKHYYPTVPMDQKPNIGMQFESEKLAYTFYNAYARVAGFSIRKDSSWQRKDGVSGKRFVCSKQGFRKCSESDGNKLKKRVITRCGCKAKVEFSVRGEVFEVNKFIEEHNHSLQTPSKVHLLRSSKEMDEGTKGMIEKWRSSGIKASQCYNVLANEAGGYDRLGYNEENIKSHIRKLARQTYGTDAKTMLDYFKSKQEENPGFFYSIQLDETGQLCNCFWVDARGRLDYNDFGDVVSFDTTYKKNKYLMPFAPFTGVNHHQMSIVFGCALLVDETEDSFVWLFEEWLRAMGNQPPRAIITDQDPAMKKAIAKVFPSATHRFCLWHILQKVPEKLGHIYREDSSFKTVWDKCIHGLESPTEFEDNWFSIIQEYNLGDNDWLKSLWDIRHMWVPVFLKDQFFAGMSTTQRSESMNDFFKDWVAINTPLNEFVKKYDMAMLKRRELINREDFKTADGNPALFTESVMEKQLAQVLTRTVFNKFQKELLAIGGCSMRSVEHDGYLKWYQISRDFHKNDCTIIYDESEQMADCSCRLFNFKGIVCRHIFLVFRLENVVELPSRYILKRWRKDAQTRIIHDNHGVALQVDSHKTATVRYSELMVLANKCAAAGSMFESSYLTTKEILQKTLVNIENKNKEEQLLQASRNEEIEAKRVEISAAANIDVESNSQFHSQSQSHQYGTSQCGSNNLISILDPKITKAKGSGKRIARNCRTCQGTGHDSRNCPKNKKPRSHGDVV